MNITIAFYNLENLFDFRDDAKTYDEDFLPISRKRWTKKRYDKKIERLGRVISMIGKVSNLPVEENSPVIIGLAEVENKKVLHDLVHSQHLKTYNYRYVHFDSKDERGIDVALLYNPKYFTMETSKPYRLYLEKENGSEDYTRDVLRVSGKLMDKYVHFLVNHWPSRREGQKESNPKRMIAAKKTADIIGEFKQNDSEAKILVMGDFNDNPNDGSMNFLADVATLYNPMSTMMSYSKGSLNHRGKWNLFDQILLTTNIINNNEGELQFESAHIFDAPFLKQQTGPYKGQPSRTFAGEKYKDGFSDHFPVFVILTL